MEKGRMGGLRVCGGLLAIKTGCGQVRLDLTAVNSALSRRVTLSDGLDSMILFLIFGL